MSLRIIDENIYLNNTVISKKTFLEHDVVEVVNIEKEHINDFYKLKNSDICNNIEIYCDTEKYSLNLLKEDDKTFITKIIGVLNEKKDISSHIYNELIFKEFSNIGDIEVCADDDSSNLNILLSTQLRDNESIHESSTKIDSAYEELVKKFF